MDLKRVKKEKSLDKALNEENNAIDSKDRNVSIYSYSRIDFYNLGHWFIYWRNKKDRIKGIWAFWLMLDIIYFLSYYWKSFCYWVWY